MRYHSISFECKERQAAFEKSLQDTPVGGTIILEKPPNFINVELFPEFDGESEGERDDRERLKRAWSLGTIPNSEGKIIIPISCTCSMFIKSKSEIVAANPQSGYRASKALLQDHFPIELGFAMTVHKAQGRTIKKLVLAISEHPNKLLRMTWESIYTSLTRVRRGDDMRLLIGKSQWKRLDYVATLGKNEDVSTFFEGYPDKPNQFVAWD